MAINELFLAVQSTDLGPLIKRTEDFVRAAKAPATLKAYSSDWRDFNAWCHGHGLQSLPAAPETVALYHCGSRVLLRVWDDHAQAYGHHKGPRNCGLQRFAGEYPQCHRGRDIEGNSPDHRNCPEREGPASDSADPKGPCVLPGRATWKA